MFIYQFVCGLLEKVCSITFPILWTSLWFSHYVCWLYSVKFSDIVWEFSFKVCQFPSLSCALPWTEYSSLASVFSLVLSIEVQIVSFYFQYPTLLSFCLIWYRSFLIFWASNEWKLIFLMPFSMLLLKPLPLWFPTQYWEELRGCCC